jgi:hypothetical protein
MSINVLLIFIEKSLIFNELLKTGTFVVIVK